MEFKKKSINALGRNRYGDYIGYRKPKSTACEDGVWVLRDARLIYSDDYTELRANGSNYAQIQGSMVFIVDEDFTADTRTVIMTPKTPDNPHSVHYKIDGDKIHWNDDDFGTTVVNAATYNNLYGAFNGVDYTGNTVSLRTGANAATSVSSEIDFFTTNHGATEVTVGSGETSIFFVAQATRHKTFTTGKELTETVTSLDSEGDGTLFLESNMGSAVNGSVDIPTNYSPSAITGWVVVYDDEDRTATSSVTVTQEGQAAVPDYLAMDIVSGGSITWKTVNSSYRQTIEYSKDSGSTWTSITSSTGGTSFNVSAGEKVIIRGNNNNYQHSSFRGSTAIYNLSGNICSLLTPTDFDAITALTSSNTYAFMDMFRETNVVDASALKLPVKVLSQSCYMYMFMDCPLLNAAPILTSATTLALSCYAGMFGRCTSLVNAPALPNAPLAQLCYSDMFKNCTALTIAPSLTATTLQTACYARMFSGCTSLTTAPALPATALTANCYENMFQGCTSLTTAPELPATTLTPYCYRGMFSGCTSLNYVKCLATNKSASYCTNNWLAGVAATGTFVKANSTSWGSGASGIPTGWTVPSSWDCYMTLTYGDFTAPQSGMWDEYTIYYGDARFPAQDYGDILVMFGPGGLLMTQGQTWNPATDATQWTVELPFTENRTYDRINIPQSLAGTTFNLQAEFGSGELGYAVYSTSVSVSVPANGGEILVSIPAF